MAKAKRNVGLEILRGIREIKRGEHGRVVTVPSVASVRESTGLSRIAVRAATGGVGPYAPGVGAGTPSAFGSSANASPHRGEEPARASRGRLGALPGAIGVRLGCLPARTGNPPPLLS